MPAADHRVTCTACRHTGPSVSCRAEAVQLAALHNDMHHRGQTVARATTR